MTYSGARDLYTGPSVDLQGLRRLALNELRKGRTHMCDSCMATIIRWAADARQAGPLPGEWTELLSVADRLLSSEEMHLATTQHQTMAEWVALPSNMLATTYEQLLEELRGLSAAERTARRKQQVAGLSLST